MLKRLGTVTRALSPTARASPHSPSQTSPVVQSGTAATRHPPPSPRLKLNLQSRHVHDNQDHPVVVYPDVQDAASKRTDLVDEVLVLLDQLLRRMDAIKPKKLRSIRLGGELRGLLGKAEDEVRAHQATFSAYLATTPGLNIQMTNFLASVHGLEPIIHSIHATSFLVNAFVKKSIQFAFQEISSYYASIFTELSLAVAQATGSAAEAAVLAALSKPTIAPVPDEPPPVDYEAMYLLGHQHYFGHGKDKNSSLAFRLYLTAATHAHVDAMVCVGCMLRDGIGTDADQEEAMTWLTRAADEGALLGASNLGLLMMDKADRCPQSTKQHELYAMALVRLTQAGDRGVAAAQYAAGTIYQRKLAPVDVTKAMDWFVKASAAAYAPADFALGHLYFDQDKALSAHHFQRALQNSQTGGEVQSDAAADARYCLGCIYSAGEDVTEDLPRALAYFRQAAEAGQAKACLEMAHRSLQTPHQALRYLLLCRIFESAEFDSRSTALRHYIAAADQGHVEAAKRAAAMFYSGVVDAKKVAPDRVKALALYTIAARKNDPEALNALGLMHEEGVGCHMDVGKAAEFFGEAAARGSSHGHFNLGCLLQSGKGIQQDYAKAKWHFAQAAALGYAIARHHHFHQESTR
ncbi:hypothetical protein H257_17754 [Aphanomyces astaci]|uniref:Uncharacterized protein n=2 Tax=Aphanomyces astaci TaxID=112090 RepID=W4FFQ9_APHAT|nr:hypothetical protein H257_17754 [Aphanomyces astaci]ETV65558.1 hypothetical protein H257_17754 [Aphanomyces astaci]|eukprot:XP_009844947.1 hypothetical protein H257_17754 [Aphanomyces astaci]